MRSYHISLPHRPVGISVDAFISRGLWTMIPARSFVRTCWLYCTALLKQRIVSLDLTSDLFQPWRVLQTWLLKRGMSDRGRRYKEMSSILSHMLCFELFFAILHTTIYLSLGFYCISQWGCYFLVLLFNLGMFSIAPALTAFSLSDYSVYSSPTE